METKYLSSHEKARSRGLTVKQHGGKVITQPDMVLPITKIYERAQSGMEIRGFDPVFLNDQFKELVGFENLDKLEQIEFARAYKKSAQNQIEELKVKIEKQKETELNNPSEEIQP